MLEYKRYFFGRVEGLLPEALAWIPQSTVAIVINHGLANIDENMPDIQLLLQVHDSLLMQCLANLLRKLAPEVRRQMLITVPYDDPLVIPVGCKMSYHSWGDIKPYELKEAA